MKSVVVGTAGHIDHGKSALVRALTGIDPDRLKEEKARGITIDLGFAHLTADGINLAFVDVPGHERFVRNMLAGVGGIDLVVLVVAADESVMPQTREHFDICRLLRVPAGIVALTKADLVDAEMLELVRLDVAELVAGSFLANAPIVPVSARTGAGLEELRTALVRTASAARGRPIDGAARLPIDRVFSMKGFGTVVTGTLVAGCIAVDDELSLVPGDRRVKVRGLQVHGASRPHVFAGERAAINLGGVEVHELERGQTLIHQGACEQSPTADALLEVLPDARPLKHGARVRFHQGTSEVLGRVAIIGPPAETGEMILAPGARGYVRLRLERPAPLARGDRFILRTYSPPRTIAGGYILDPLAPRAAIRSDAAVERCRRLDFDPSVVAGRQEAELRAAGVFIEEAGASAEPAAALVSRAAIAPSSLAARVAALESGGAALRVKDVLVARPVLDRLKTAIVSAVTEHHRTHPVSDGLAREEARMRLFGRGHPAVFERALEDLGQSRTVIGRERLSLATHRVALAPDAERTKQTIEDAFRKGGLTPPDVASVVSASGAPPAVARDVLTLLQRQKVLVKLDTLLFHDEALKRLKVEIAGLKQTGELARIDVPTFKERFGITRKFAIPLLEYLDRERVTRREGDVRIVL